MLKSQVDVGPIGNQPSRSGRAGEAREKPEETSETKLQN